MLLGKVVQPGLGQHPELLAATLLETVEVAEDLDRVALRELRDGVAAAPVP